MDTLADGIAKAAAAQRPVVPLAGRLPRLALSDCHALNDLARHRAAFRLPARVGEIRIRPCAPAAVGTEGISFAPVDLTIDAQPARLFLPARVLTALTQVARLDLPLADVPEEGRALVFEHLLDDVLTGLEATGAAVSIRSIGAPVRPAAGALGFWCRIGALPEFTGFLDAEAGLCARILAAADRLGAPEPRFDDVPVTVRILAGVTDLTFGELGSLAAGDTVVCDHSWLGQRQVAVVIGGRRLLRAGTGSGGFLLAQAQDVRDAREGRAWLSDSPISAGAYMDNKETTSLDEVEVKLVFEVGRLTMTMAELNRLDAGHVFDLNRAPDQAVDVFVMNRQIGSGELVLVGERIGVRLTRLAR